MGTFVQTQKKGYYSETNKAKELKFSLKVRVIITVSVVTFAKSFRLKFARKIEKRPHTYFLTKQAILQKQKMKFNETSKNTFLGMETI